MAINRFKDLPDRTTPINAQSLNEMKNVELLAVSDEAPEVFSEGQQYYNKTDKVIYTASSTAWKVDGEKPIEGIFYIVKGTKSNYYYDVENDDLISVGGGSDAVPTGAIMEYDGEEVPVGYEEIDNVLFESTNGATSNITLKDSLANYSKIEIFAKHWYFDYYKTFTFYNPNGKRLNLDMLIGDGGTMYFSTSSLVASDNTLTVGNTYAMNTYGMRTASNLAAAFAQMNNDNSARFKIYKIVGYK